MRRYQDVIVGNRSFAYLLFFEWCKLAGALPGALGQLMRKLFWPMLFGACGNGVFFGERVVLRHPRRVHLGNRVIISDGCILDARNPELELVLSIGSDVTLSNGVMISCKNGRVNIGDRVGINAFTIIHSVDGNSVTIGEDTILGPRCYLVGGGDYNTDRLDVPINRQGIRQDGGVVIEPNVWLSANVTVLGGVHMGTGAIAGAGAVITDTIPPNAICVGVPAKVIKIRENNPSGR